MEEQIHKAVEEALAQAGVSGAPFVVERPTEGAHGDYTTNAAMAAAKNVKKNPRELADSLAAALREVLGESMSKVEVAGPGFINFTLAPSVIVRAIAEADARGEEWGRGNALGGKKILIEKSAPNLFKPFHIGHLVNISIGEALSRLMRFSGGNVTDVAYPSDISLGVAKAVWAIMDKKVEDILTINLVGECYAYGTKMYEEDEAVQRRIIEINTNLNVQKEGPEWEVYQKGRELNLDYFKSVAARLGSEFADYFFESESGKVGKEIVEAHIGDVFEKSNGAIIFPGEKYGLHTRVFLTSLGLPVYEAKDIGLLKLKFDKYNPDLSFVFTDVEQKQYFEVIKKVASLINPVWGERSTYWQHGRLRLESGKISSRLGNVPLAEDLIEQVKQTVREKMASSVKKAEASDAMVEQVAIGALKFAFLRSAPGSNIVFDFESSVSLTGDSGPYLQYALVRAIKILSYESEDAGGAEEPAEPYAIERLILHFPEVTARAARELAPNLLANYLLELAGEWNSFYGNEQVLGSPEEQYKQRMTRAFANTMANGLRLLGIPAPEQM